MRFIVVAFFLSWFSIQAQVVSDFRYLKSPASAGSQVSNLHTRSDGTVFLTWIEKGKGKEAKLLFSQLKDTTWAEPKIIYSDTLLFVNWADFPTITSFGKSGLVTNLLVKSGLGKYAYDVKLLISNDNGETWSGLIPAHFDNTQTEHGFVSLVPFGEEEFMAIWLDGRKMEGHAGHDDHEGGGEMTLRSSVFDKYGKVKSEYLIDERVCDCCQTSAINTDGKIYVVYRDRSPEEIRDISIAVFENGKWTIKGSTGKDNWNIKGCPVNGPALGYNKSIPVVWFTSPKGKPVVKATFLGKKKGKEIVIDKGKPVGRVDVIALPDGSALASWITSTSGSANLAVQKFSEKKVTSSIQYIANSSEVKAAGFPKMTLTGNKVIFAWTEPGSSSQIRTAIGYLR